MKRFRSEAAVIFLLLANAAALAQVRIPDEYSKLIRSRTEVPGLGPQLFGDQLSLYTGAIEFVQTDVAVPGNNALPVSVGRRFVVGRNEFQYGLFDDWDLEIPHLHGVFSRAGWIVPGSPSRRCTYFGEPPGATGLGGGSFGPTEFWAGNFLYLPGAGDQEILKRFPGTTAPTDGLAYPLVTKQGAAIRCLAAPIANDPGEGFEVLTPDGVRYRFDHIASRDVDSLMKSSPEPQWVRSGNSGAATGTSTPPTLLPDGYLLYRKEVWLMPTLVTDRFGNTVTYQWDETYPWKLHAITASDGRTLSFTYSGGRIASVTHGQQTWSYGYSGYPNGPSLTRVTLPDMSAWTFQLFAFSNPQPLTDSSCDGPNVNDQDLIGTMTHPSGAQGAFTLSGTLHGRSWVPRICMGGDTIDYGTWVVYPREFSVFSLIQKTIRGPGLPAGGSTWSYSYGPANQCWDPASPFPVPPGSLLCTTSSPTSKTVSVTDPDNVVTRHTFGNRYRVNEGQLQQVDVGWNGSTAVRTTRTLYADPDAGPYPNPVGVSAQVRGDGDLSTRHTPVSQTTTVQQGRTFVFQANSFDTVARPTSVTRSSAPTP